MAFVTVAGRVNRVFYQGKGVEVIESYQVRGETKQKRWTAWFDDAPDVFEGQDLEVTGLHGDEVDEWTDKEDKVRHTVKRSLNKAKVKGSGNAPVQSAAEPEPWAASEVPF